MNKRNKIILLSSITSTTIPIVAISCSTNFHTSQNYDLGLVSEPINSLNYIKFSSVNRILPSLVESPLKSGPNEALKRILSLPEIPMGAYVNSEVLDEKEERLGVTSLDKYIQNNSAPTTVTTRFYPLDQFGSTTGTLSSDSSEYQPVSVIMLNNRIQSMNLLLNNGESKWSNNDPVTADDYIDAMHYILDLSTGSQKLTSILQRKFEQAEELIEAQHEYIKEFGISYKNPFAYPEVKLDKNGNSYYDVFNENYKPFASQIEDIIKYRKENNLPIDSSSIENLKNKEKELLNKLKKSALGLGLFSGRLYWNHSNREILEAIPYSPDFNENDNETVIMLKNPEYSLSKYSEAELKSIPQRIAVKIKKYLYSDPRQTFSELFKNLTRDAKKLKTRMTVSYSKEKEEEYNVAVNSLYRGNTLDNEFTNNLNPKHYRHNRLFALDEYSLRVEYQSYQPTSLSNAVSDLNSNLIPINRKFVELNGGIADFGLDKNKFLTNGAFNIEDIELGPQGYVILNKNVQYYSSDKTSSNKIKILFSSDPNLNATLYDDKFIASTRIPAVQQLNYWVDPEKRKYMRKSAGFGTIALAFNLDKETNSKSPLQDSNLRNAIYYAINRNEMLNIVGWNSSYPVITWTAFGQGASAFGDPIEIAFDHEVMKTKINDKEFPIQNYTHLDHLSKNYNFEHVDRTDKAFDLEIARGYLELFKKSNPDIKKVDLKYISNSSDEQQHAGIALQDFMAKAFGDFVNIEIKSLPENVYEDFRTKGEYDILYKNFDAFGTDAYSYVRVFFKTDEIDTKNQKNTGFRNNPAGSWVYANYFEELGYKIDENGIITSSNNLKADETRKRLRIDLKVWNKILELVFKGKKVYDKELKAERIENDNEFSERYLRFFSNNFTQTEIKEGWTEQNAFAIIAALEKIVRDGAPVIPLMEVDTFWEISRVNGTDSLFTYSLQFAYDTIKPPKPNLPTQIKGQ